MKINRTSKEEWLEHLITKKIKFFVLKSEDFLTCLNDEEIDLFNDMLRKHENYRVSIKKKPVNNYYVVNTDEPYSEEIRKNIEKHEGQNEQRKLRKEGEL
jgi:hypothetical protein